MWIKHVVYKSDFPVKIYVDQDDKTAVIFFLFGRYSVLRSDKSALDFAVDFILGNPNNVVSLNSYLNSLENTVIIEVA